MLTVQRHRVLVQIAETRAQAQAAIGGEAAETAFSHFRDLIQKVEVEDTQKKMRSALDKVSKMGPISVKPLQTPQKASSIPTVPRSASPLVRTKK